jgi:hypothetical protein
VEVGQEPRALVDGERPGGERFQHGRTVDAVHHQIRSVGPVHPGHRIPERGNVRHHRGLGRHVTAVAVAARHAAVADREHVGVATGADEFHRPILAALTVP